MKKIYLAFFLLLFGISTTFAQNNYYYYYKGEKIFLTIDKKYLNIFTVPEFQKTSISNLNFNDFSLEIDNSTDTIQKFAKLESSIEPSDLEYYQKINSLKSNLQINTVNLYFKRPGTSSIGISNIFYIKLKNVSDSNILKEFASQKNVQIVKQIPYMPEWYMLSLNKGTIGNSLDLTNQFWESGLFADIDPGFMFNFKHSCTNDPSFGSLWGLNNTANPNIDINACQAWTISQGNGVKVAVVDGGIEKTHNDLAASIHPLSFDMNNGTSPSIISDDFHGTHVAGTIAAVKDNNLQVVGVAPQSKLMSVSHNFLLIPNVASSEFASGISWAWQNGAEVINNSWGDQGGIYLNTYRSAILENAILNAMTLGRNGKGSVVVFSSGNWGVIDYPAYFHPNIVTVGAINSSGQRSIFNSTQSSGFGQQLDVVAPGSFILSTSLNNTTENANGTSMSAPHVSGVAALLLSVNPCLTLQEVTTILESTSQKVGGYNYTNTTNRPNGTWNNQMGYGLVDAYAAVLMAQQMNSSGLDLIIKDSPADTAIEPNTITPYMWNSEDIWVRNFDDNGITHQNPDYSPTSPNYVYVRIKNNSCFTSLGNEKINLYWAKAATSLQWPTNWNGTTFPNNGPQLGNIIGNLTIPILQTNQEIILKLPWQVPNPSDYTAINSEPWHFCLLARIEAVNDPMTFTETFDLNSNVRNNNNIAWKNVSVVDVLTNRISGVIAVGNPYNEARTFLLELVKENAETGKPIYEEAEVTLKMDNILFNAWDRGGKNGQQFDSTLDINTKKIKGNNVILNNINFNPNEVGTLNLTFNFLTEELTDKTDYRYHVIQKDVLTGEIIGGETYHIIKPTRTKFIADAGDKVEVDMNQPITITAQQINEPAQYNWYDSSGNLIYQGQTMTPNTGFAKKYKLEVIALSDGFKDYAEVEVAFKPSVIENISPNPATTDATINYKLNGISSAYLMIIGSYGNNHISNNYILNTSSTQTNISLNNYPEGYYTVALVCNGEIVDAKTLIKQ